MNGKCFPASLFCLHATFYCWFSRGHWTAKIRKKCFLQTIIKDCRTQIYSVQLSISYEELIAKKVLIFKMCRFDQTVNKSIQLRSATHLRYSPYLIGLILGYIFFKNRGKKVYISKVSPNVRVHLISYFTFYSLFPSDVERIRMVDVNHHYNIDHCRSLSIFGSRYWYSANSIRSICGICSNILDTCLCLHHFCMPPWVRRTCEYDYVSVILATTV